MRLLIDANLSPALVSLLEDVFPGSLHVLSIHEESAEDSDIWDYALKHDLIIVTKDSDFDNMSQLASKSPKIVWLRRGNCSTTDIERIIRSNTDAIQALGDPINELSVLVLM